jgi:hypothetical protein
MQKTKNKKQLKVSQPSNLCTFFYNFHPVWSNINPQGVESPQVVVLICWMYMNCHTYQTEWEPDVIFWLGLPAAVIFWTGLPAANQSYAKLHNSCFI